jgi:hypothetical protein
MGLAAYRALIEDICQHAPWADQTGLTRQLLSESRQAKPS